MSKFNKLYVNIIKQNVKELSRYSYDYFPITQTFPIEEQLLLKSLINESKDPNYFVKLPKEIQDITIDGKFIDDRDLKVIFPQIEVKLPKVLVSIIDFDNKQDCSQFLKSISNISNTGINIALNIILKDQNKRGQLIDLTVVGKPLVILLFNKKQFNVQTIYHEWTHYFQRFVGDQIFFKIIKLHEQKQKEIKQNLKLFNLTYDFIKKTMLNDKEYITHLDNLLYLILHVQKLDKYKHLKDHQFFNIFKQIKDLDNQLVNDILQLNPLFKIDILFYIGCRICLNEDQINELNNQLALRM